VELSQMLAEAHFSPADIAVVHREEEAPHFETVMAMAAKPNTLSGN
jgi:ArsR family transcriptional regulator